MQKSQPDIVVLDWIMEGFTCGFDLARDINLKFQRLPLIMSPVIREQMSSDWLSGAEDRDWLPVNTFIEKPSDPNVLLREIKKLPDKT